MEKDYSSKLRKVLRKKQYRIDDVVCTRSKLIILEEQAIWTNGNLLLVDDPTMIKSIGGEYLINNYLKKSPIFYEIIVKDNAINITDEMDIEEMADGVKELIEKSRKDLTKTTIHEFRKIKQERGFKLEDFDLGREYIKGTFQDNDLETFSKNDYFLYFFEKDKVKAIVA